MDSYGDNHGCICIWDLCGDVSNLPRSIASIDQLVEHLKRGCIIICTDSREHFGSTLISSKFEQAGTDSQICTFPQWTGCDYYIVNTYGSVCIQRKDSASELCSQMEELRYDILPRLVNFASETDSNPILLVEETHTIGDAGYLFRRGKGNVFIETGLHISSYYGFLETIRLMGIEVVTTKGLTESIWYMIAMDGFLAKQHYPKHLKSYKHHQQALGVLCCIPTIGSKRAAKALEECSIAEMLIRNEVEGLTKTQLEKVKKALRSRL